MICVRIDAPLVITLHIGVCTYAPQSHVRLLCSVLCVESVKLLSMHSMHGVGDEFTLACVGICRSSFCTLIACTSTTYKVFSARRDVCVNTSKDLGRRRRHYDDEGGRRMFSMREISSAFTACATQLLTSSPQPAKLGSAVSVCGASSTLR